MSALRKAFERWRSEGGKYPNTIARVGSEGAYRYADTVNAWEAWQAGARWRKAQPSQSPALLDVTAAKDTRIRELESYLRIVGGAMHDGDALTKQYLEQLDAKDARILELEAMLRAGVRWTA
jgi:hypothetical protein